MIAVTDKSRAYKLGVYDGFVSGYEEGKLKWHDLRKDPNDLPSTDDLVLFRTKIQVYLGKIDFYKNLWWTGEWLNYSINNVVAWCEIPKYEEE